MGQFNLALYHLASGSIDEAVTAYRERAPGSPEVLLRIALADLELLKRWGPWHAVAGGAIATEIGSRLNPAPGT
jgi:hypothetical protein